MLTVKCSPARSIYVFDQYHYSPLAVNAWDGDTFEEGASNIFEKVHQLKPIKEAMFKIKPLQELIRIEVVDYHGRSAWSNPYYRNPDQIQLGLIDTKSTNFPRMFNYIGKREDHMNFVLGCDIGSQGIKTVSTLS